MKRIDEPTTRSASFVVLLWHMSKAEAACLESIATQRWDTVELVCIGGKGQFERLPRRSRRVLTTLQCEADIVSASIPEALNRGITMAGGEAIFLITEPVLLPPDFTATWMKRLFDQTDTGFVYGDFVETGPDRKETVRTTRTDSFDYSEMSQIGPARALKRAAAIAVGLYDETLEHAYEYDFRLRMLEQYTASHVSSPLYRNTAGCQRLSKHWRRIRHVSCYVPVGSRSHLYSYLGYAEPEEAEFRDACAKSLKRRNAYLDDTVVPLNCPHGSYILPCITVVIPVWNRGKYIERALESVLTNKRVLYEVIVIDNGSSDRGRVILQKYRDKGLIRLFDNPVNNTAASLNIGLQLARGKYICQLDSDDVYTPDTLKLLFSYMEANPNAALGVSYYDCIGPDDEALQEFGVVKHLEYDRNNLMRTDGIGAARIWHRCVLEELGGFDEKNLGSYGEDYDLQLKVSEHYDVLRIPHVLYRYRKNHKSEPEHMDYPERHKRKTYARREAIRRRQTMNRSVSARRSSTETN